MSFEIKNEDYEIILDLITPPVGFVITGLDWTFSPKKKPGDSRAFSYNKKWLFLYRTRLLWDADERGN